MKQTSDKIFLDTNILIYLYSIDELKKREVAENILERHNNRIISTQVNEFISVMNKKRKINSADLMPAIKEL